jgi:hypothetical protein
MANESYSVYPEHLDSYGTMPLRRDGVHEIVAADVNRLRDAIIKIEYELGVQPSGTFATVASRLDNIGDAKALILAHLADTEDAHDASAISILDEEDHYFGDDVEEALEELSSLLPPQPDNIGEDNSKVPNDGIPTSYDGYGTKFIFNISSSDTIQKRTQPSSVDPGIRGIHVFEVSINTPDGDGYLKMAHASSISTLSWMAPGDSTFGNSVVVRNATWELGQGEVLILTSSDTNKRIRVTRNNTSLVNPGEGVELIEHFEIYGLESVHGYYSLPSEGFKFTRYITRTATNISGNSRLQSMIGGMVFPADRGTLVLQRKLRGVSDFFPVAVLDLGTAFDNTTRTTGQKVYTPTLENFDTITLYDRYPVKKDYSSVNENSDGEQPYDNFENDFTRLQIAKYLIPISNDDVVGGALSSPNDITEVEANDNISSYRILHFKENSTASYTGNPASTDLYSSTDTTWVIDDHDGHSPIRFSNVYVDSSPTRPGIELINLRPVSDTPSIDGTTMRSGIKYYNGADDLFEFELRSDNNVFNKTYKYNDILTFETNVLNFPNGISDGYWGANVAVTELLDDGYMKWSSSNLPSFGDQTYYIVDDTTLINGTATNESRRLYPASDRFSTHTYISGTMNDPFGPGDGYTAFGAESIHRILVNSHSITRSTNTTEYFTDESKRMADSVSFTKTMIIDGYDDLSSFDYQSPLPIDSLQVGGRFTDTEYNIPGLIYPQTDYYNVRHRIRPYQVDLASMDYSTKTGDLSYRRLFTLGYPINSGKLRVVSNGESPISFWDIQHNNQNRFGRIEVKIPGTGTNSTEWLDISRLFETGQYYGPGQSDGYGALYGEVTGNSGDFTVPFTFGPRNTADAIFEDSNNTYNYAIAVKVTYFGSTLAQREISKQKILTMLQLLP